MELYFNELSLDSSLPVEYAYIINLKEVYRRSKLEGFSVCRFSVSDRKAIFEYLQSNPRLQNIRSIMNFAYAFFASPYEKPLSDLEETQFMENSWSYQGEPCGGLAWACIYDTLSLSIASENWLSPSITILRGSDQASVHHVSMGNHFDDHHDWLGAKKEVSLVPCPIAVEDKHILLRDDHGQNILYALAIKIVRNPYVVGVVNSLPFNPHCHRFIKSVKPNGIVEIVLIWTDSGIGLVVQTTGRNLRETQKIAEHLEEEFGYR
ncbi:MAG: hypothetical protein RBR15_10170 [Sphaerochaeta sp.]|nr:hypothetical protein [Sphaerochaeta sp.]